MNDLSVSNCPDGGVSHRDFSRKPKRDKRHVNASNSCRLISRPDGGNGTTATPPTGRKGKSPVDIPQIQANLPSTWTSLVNVGKKRKKSSS